MQENSRTGAGLNGGSAGDGGTANQDQNLGKLTKDCRDNPSATRRTSGSPVESRTLVGNGGHFGGYGGISRGTGGSRP